ncbi:MAG: flagellin FliC [Planctomycetes bacterium]|nr:flagellin FliC [Planctomycetota bacterium]
MAMIVNTNMASMVAQKNLTSVTARLQGNYSRLSSGLRITSASEDAAGLEISERLRSKVRAWGVAGRNTQDGISLTQTAEGALNEVNNMLSRMRELATQSANGTLGSTERTTLDNEFQQLIEEIDRIATTTEFNGIQLLDGTSTTADFQVGIDAGDTISVNLQDTTATTLGIGSLDVTSAANASSAISAIESAIDSVNASRGELGASTNRLQSAFVNTQTQRENLSAAESRIRDVDVAAETADLTRNGILQQAAVSVLSQANVQPQLALRLLG